MARAGVQAWWVAALCAAALALLAPATAHAAYPGTDGRFLFSDAGGSKSTISALDPSTRRANVVAAGTIGHAAVAGDGRTVAFVRQMSGLNFSVWAADIDGGNERMVIDGFNFLTDVAISRDGTKIAFTGTDLLGPRPVSAGLFVVNSDGTGLRTVSGFSGSGHVGVGANNASEPSFSPDGSKLVFVGLDGEFRCGKERFGQDPDIYEVGVDGSGERTIASDPRRSEYWPSYSPNGKRVAFHRPEVVGDECPGVNEIPPVYSAIWSRRAGDGGGERLMFRGKTSDPDGKPGDSIQYLFYAPSGTRIAFWLNDDLVTVSSRRSKPKRVRGKGIGRDTYPLDWAPHG